jgi:hypothetical protein
MPPRYMGGEYWSRRISGPELSHSIYARVCMTLAPALGMVWQFVGREAVATEYLSKDPAHLAKLQRDRRKRIRRVDYMPGRDALAVFEARQEIETPGSLAATNSAVLDAILIEWAELTGIKCGEVEPPMSLARLELRARPMTLAKSHAINRARVRCGAKRHRDGEPCQALSEPGKRRCRFHGGKSTGPRTPEGKARCTANLPRQAASAHSG